PDRVHAGVELERDLEEAGIHAPGERDVRVDAELLLVDQRPLQARALSGAEGGLDQIEDQGIGVSAARSAKAGEQGWRLRGIADDGAALALLRRLSRRHWRQPVAGRDLSVQPFDLPQRGPGLEVADQHQRAVVRGVVAAEVALAVRPRDRLDVAHPADHRPAVWMGEEGE